MSEKYRNRALKMRTRSFAAFTGIISSFMSLYTCLTMIITLTLASIPESFVYACEPEPARASACCNSRVIARAYFSICSVSSLIFTFLPYRLNSTMTCRPPPSRYLMSSRSSAASSLKSRLNCSFAILLKDCSLTRSSVARSHDGSKSHGFSAMKSLVLFRVHCGPTDLPACR